MIRKTEGCPQDREAMMENVAWEINQKIADARRRHISDFSFVGPDGKTVIVHIEDPQKYSVDTDLL
ncbi:MAG TPA: hypothetical protein VJH22_02025 [Candidatus Nanoarchaeia archaeon]|nr:hypothetical protein [Candidatus Nanoarchaeia archaeon]